MAAALLANESPPGKTHVAPTGEPESQDGSTIYHNGTTTCSERNAGVAHGGGRQDGREGHAT